MLRLDALHGLVFNLLDYRVCALHRIENHSARGEYCYQTEQGENNCLLIHLSARRTCLSSRLERVGLVNCSLWNGAFAGQNTGLFGEYLGNHPRGKRVLLSSSELPPRGQSHRSVPAGKGSSSRASISFSSDNTNKRPECTLAQVGRGKRQKKQRGCHD